MSSASMRRAKCVERMRHYVKAVPYALKGNHAIMQCLLLYIHNALFMYTNLNYDTAQRQLDVGRAHVFCSSVATMCT